METPEERRQMEEEALEEMRRWRLQLERTQREIIEQAEQWRARQRAVWAKTQGRCWYCGIQTRLASPNTANDQFTIDHFVARSQGGTDDFANLVPACRACNIGKRDRTLEEYRALLARRGLPVFTDKHIAYLLDLGIHLPHGFPCYPVHRFWYEQQDDLFPQSPE